MFKEKENLCELLKLFYSLGWCTGTGGGISIRVDNSVLLAPSGVEKEKVLPNMISTVKLDTFEIIENPVNYKISECAPLFHLFYKYRDCGSVIHSHAIESMLIGRYYKDEFTIKDVEMIKGIRGHKNTDTLVIPIIDNTARESELKEELDAALQAYPDTCAVIVRDHGIYVCGDSAIHAKTQAESIHYLLKIGLEIAKDTRKMQKYTQRHPRLWKICNDKKVLKNKLEKEFDLRGNNPFLENNILSDTGIVYKRLSGEEDDVQLKNFCKEHNYDWSDIVDINPQKMGDKFHTLINTFFEEHYHDDPEIRYIIGGSGYFDIKDLENNWYRIQMTKGDMIILPAGIYHRFTTDRSDNVKAMRFFCGNPVWKAISPNDDSQIRKSYKSSISKKNKTQSLFL